MATDSIAVDAELALEHARVHLLGRYNDHESMSITDLQVIIPKLFRDLRGLSPHIHRKR